MKLIFRGHDDRYAVEQSLLAFFPEERPVYKPAEEGEDHALVTLSRSPRFNTAVTTITYHGRTARGISRTAVNPQLTEYEAERLRQKAVKLSFFKAAREITGITPSWGALTGIRPGKLASRMLEEGMTERQVERVLRDTYFVSPERRRLCIETAEASRRAKAELKPEDISLYVGIPFCPTRCAYCSFVSQSVERTLGLVEPYLEVLHREITNAALRQADFRPYYLYRQKYMSGSFENTGWCISGAEGLYNIYIMEELHSILSLGAGGSTKMVDPVHQRIERVFHTKYPTEYIQRSEKLEENLSAFRQFHENMRG